MNIVYIATDSYVSMLGISLFSLLENNKSMEKLNIYILSTDLSQTNQNVLRQMADSHHRQLHFVQIGDYQRAFSADTNTSGFHPIVLARLLLTRYLPQEVHTVLYLDCDTIIHGSLDAMEPADFCRTDYAFAAATIAANFSATSEAPPIRPPSTSSLERSSAAFASFIEPPYWIVTLSAASLL